MSVVRIINLSIQIWGSSLCFILVLCLTCSGKVRLKSEKLYLTMLIFNALTMIMDALALYFRGRMGTFHWYGVRITNFLGFATGIGLSLSFLLYQKAYIEQKAKIVIHKIYEKVAIGVACWSIAMLIVNLFFPFLYVIGKDNLYRRLQAYPIVFITTFTVFILSVSLIVKYRKYMEVREIAIFSVYVFVPIISVIFTALVYGIVFAHLGSTVTILIMFVFLQSEQGRIAVEQENELMQGRIDIALSQIQPHFLYNTLSTISVLCQKEPLLASEATDSFAKYLRVNLDSMNRKVPVNFEDELNHIKTYIWLEQLRFGDDLVIEYEIETVHFKVPVLSIQPLVENAVVHGMMGRTGVCHIKLSTKELESYIEVTVEDDGVGFDMTQKKEDGRSHVGISNVRKRLDYISKGKLYIDSKIGEGTKVTIQLPKNSI